MVTALALLGFCLWLASILGQLVLVAHVLQKTKFSPSAPIELPPLSLLKPLKGAIPGLRENLESFFQLDYPCYEILFSVASEDDPALGIVRELLVNYPNCDAKWVHSPGCATVVSPKIGNLLVSYPAAKYDWLLLTDSNVFLPADYLKRVSSYLDSSVGLLTAVPMGSRASGLGGRLDAALLNTFYAKGMWFCNLLGRPVAAGKALCFRRSEAEKCGGLAALGDFLADDVRLGKIFEARGLPVRLMAEPVPQSSYGLSLRASWIRHQRWFRNRRALMPRLYCLEPFVSTLVAMMLGIGLHGCLAYMRWPLPTWPIRDAHKSLAADLFVYAAHSFRMQLFFVLAGFFGCLVYRRYGKSGFIRHRFRRIAVPLFFSVFLIQPQMQALSMYQETVEQRAVQLHPDLKPSFREYLYPFDAHSQLAPGTVVARHFSSGTFLHFLTPMHLWFLYYLLICYTIMLLAIALKEHLDRSDFPKWKKTAESCRRGARALLDSPWAVPCLVLLTLPVLYRMKTWQVDSSSSWVPVPRILVYYLGFFGLGWFLYSELSLLESLSRPWKRALFLSILFLPVAGLLTAQGLPLELTHGSTPLPSYFPWLKAAALFAQASFTWLMVWGFFGLFLAVLNRARPWVRYLADSSYWCYLLSLTPIVTLQIWLAPYSLPWGVKLALVIGGSTIFLLLTYEWLVRYTFIGVFLHGKKERPARDKIGVSSIVGKASS